MIVNKNYFFRSWLNKLPDKGEKIQNLYERACEALTKKDGIENAENLLKSLKIESKDIENLEWEGKILVKKEAIDSDDEEESDPLAVLASTNSILATKKIVKHEVKEEPLITLNDLKEIKSERLILDPVLQHVCDIENMTPDFRFLPFKNAKVHEHPDRNRDNSAATPPITKQSTIMLSLRESIETENKNRQLLKDLSEKHAVERLAERMKAMKAAGIEISAPPMVLSASVSMSKYRLPPEENDEDDDSDNDSFESALSDEIDEA